MGTVLADYKFLFSMNIIEFIYIFHFWLHCATCRILVPWPGIKPAPLALEAQSLNHWSTSVSFLVMSDSLWSHGRQPARPLCPLISPGKNTGEGCHPLLQGIFPIQGSNLGLLHCRQMLYHLRHQGSPREDPNLYSFAHSEEIKFFIPIHYVLY